MRSGLIEKGNIDKGATVFQSICASCHKLKGQGGNLGPDLTGSDRRNLTYILENLIDPSAMVAKDFRISIIKMKDGTGVLESATEETYQLTAIDGRKIIPKSEVKEVEVVEQSLMPEGLIEVLTEEQVLDLVAYLMRS